MNDNLFNIYTQELIAWNKKFNLTSITDPEEIKIKHFEDSLSILQTIQLATQSVIDIGTGAGFPGIPLKIKCPGIKLTLLEATKKKTEFLKHIVKILNLQNVEIIWGRAEELNKKPQYKGKYDIAVARAVAKMDKLVDYCLPFVKPGGTFIAQKGPNVLDELKTVKLKSNAMKIKNISLSNGDKRSLVIISAL